MICRIIFFLFTIFSASKLQKPNKKIILRYKKTLNIWGYWIFTQFSEREHFGFIDNV